MSFKTLDPEVVLKLLEGQEDVLTPEVKKLEAFYRQFKCPNCKGSVRKEYSSGHAFSDPDTLVARALLRCIECDHLFDPHSGMTVERGLHVSKVSL